MNVGALVTSVVGAVLSAVTTGSGSFHIPSNVEDAKFTAFGKNVELSGSGETVTIRLSDAAAAAPKPGG